MGNWRTVNIVGTFDVADVTAAREHLQVKPDFSNFGPLSISHGLCSLADWPAPTVMAIGNLAERDYSVEDVVEALTGLVAVAPSARLKVHCGDDWEALACIATITVADGAVTVGQPEVPTLAKLSDDVTAGRLFRALSRPPVGEHR